MSKVAITDTLLNNLSDSIADKADISTSLTIAEMKTAIENRIQKRSVTKKIVNFIDYDGRVTLLLNIQLVPVRLEICGVVPYLRLSPSGSLGTATSTLA